MTLRVPSSFAALTRPDMPPKAASDVASEGGVPAPAARRALAGLAKP